MGKPSTSFPLLIIVVVTVAAAGAGGSSPEVPCYFIFGDSIFDGGNNNNLATSAKANYLPYGTDFPTGPTGRFTNGQTTADILGQLLGFDSLIPSFASKPNRSELLVGVNYASGSAGILFESGKILGDNFDMGRQVRNHGLTVSSVANILGSKKSAYDYLAKCLYISNPVNNDYVNNYLLLPNISKLYNPDQFAELLVRTYSSQIKDLYNLGARKVALAGVFPIGCLPRFIATPGPGRTNGSLCVESLNQLVAPFNSRLRVLVDQLNVDFPDAKFVYLDSTSVFNLASQALGIKTVSCCQVLPINSFCIPNSVPCPISVRRTYLFWDGLHPTEAANRVVAPALYQAIKPIGVACRSKLCFCFGRDFIRKWKTNDNVEMDKQISNHGVTLSSITDILGSQKAAYDHLAKCFYISNMGNNDYINNYLLPQSSDIREKYNPDQFAALLVEKYSVQIKSMYNLGARKVGLVGVSPVGCTPSAIAASGGTGGLFCDDSANRVVEPFNVRLRALVDRFNVDFPDAKFVYLDSTTASTLAGLAFPIRTVPCCEVSVITGLCIRDSVPCPVLVRHLYLFWDAFHPVEASNRLVASIFYGAIKPILVNDSPLL